MLRGWGNLTGPSVIQAIDRGWPGARVSVVVRARFIEDALKKALADGIDQVVIVGSGFDTRPYRVPARSPPRNAGRAA